MDKFEQIITAIELHAVEEIQQCFKRGLNPNELYNGEPLIYELSSEYTRSPRFKDCVRAFADHGLKFPDSALLAVLLDDEKTLESLLKQDAELMTKTYTLRSAYTALLEVTLLHICAEFNHVGCARILVKYGADINATAGVDEYGFGGQTPIFHTVNQNMHQSAAMLDYLLSLPVNLHVTVRGLIWGKGYPWETLLPAVNPLSYAMMGMLPQMHRDERIIAGVVSQLLKKAYDIDYAPTNIPNAYLEG